MWILFGSKLKFFLDELDILRSSNSQLKMEISFIKEALENERNERNKLQDSILIRSGYLPSNKVASVDISKNFKPLGRAAVSWPRIKQSLEMDARKNTRIRNHSKEDLNKTIEEINEVIENEESKSAS